MAFAKHIAIGLKKNGAVEFIASRVSVVQQCDLEREAVNSGKYKQVIRINDDESIFELVCEKAYMYKRVD